MKNYLFKYIKENYNKTIEEEPFCLMDAFIFSLISYVPFEDVPLKEHYTTNEAINVIDSLNMKGYNKRKNKEILLTKEVLKSKRFESLELIHPKCVNDEATELRFFAISLKIANIFYVSYRGTDSTVIGWKEDLNMSFMSYIPAHTEAKIYLDEIINQYQASNISLGGHSKGGSLAVFSSIYFNEAIFDNIYSFDGPGFSKSFYDDISYNKISQKVIKIVPESSIIGMLLHQPDTYKVIKSVSHSIMQHDPFNWIIKDNDFIFVKDITKNYKNLSISINKWVEGASVDEKIRFCEAIYSVFKEMDIDEFKNTAYNAKMYLSCIPKVIPFIKNANKEDARLVFTLFKTLIDIYKEESKNDKLNKVKKIESKTVIIKENN